MGQVSDAASKSGQDRTTRKTNAAIRLEDQHDLNSHEHQCKQNKQSKIHHWFGQSSEEETSESEDEDKDKWTKVEREARNKLKMKKKKYKIKKQKAEVARKARSMVRIGPITDQEIEIQRLRTKDYETAKQWAIKAHLADKYSYNQQELDELNILETKRTNREEIVYFAVEKEAEIRDIYYRKAECRQDDTTVKLFIPPQYHERFTAINRICAQSRDKDRNLKTQIRFGYEDLIVLTKHKGSEDPYREVDLWDFAGDNQLPEFNSHIKWRILEDRPPRRRVNTSENPASRQSQQTARKPIRQHSNTARNTKCILIGDLNLDYTRWANPDFRTKKMVQDTKDQIETQGFCQMIKNVTRSWPGQPSSLVDHLWTNSPGSIISTMNVVRAASDHNHISATIRTKDRTEYAHEITIRDRKNMSLNEYRDKLKSLDWTEFYSSEDINKFNDFFVTKVGGILDMLAPLKNHQMRSNHKNWINPEIKTEMEARNASRELARRSGSAAHWADYKKRRNLCSKNLLKLKKIMF